jgi:tetratricopeptide (TPR) repeat protein
MGTLLKLFAILDGYDEDRPLDQVRVNPDPALALARRALQGAAPIHDALDALDAQLRIVRPCMRAQQFDLIETVHSENGWSEDKIFQLAGDLHRYSALLLLADGCVDAARQHLLCAITCHPGDPNLVFHLVDAYAREERFADAFALLDRTFDTFAPGRPEKILGLYRLSLDARKAGKAAAARQLFEAISVKPDAGAFVDLCRRQLKSIDRAESTVPDIETLSEWYGAAIERHRAGNHGEAIATLYDVLTWEPTHETSWFFLGYIHATLGHRVDDSGATIVPVSIDNDRRRQLNVAVQALRLVTQFEARPDVMVESQRMLTISYMELADSAGAVEAALAVTRMDEQNAASWSNLSMALLANLAFADAGEAALRALDLDEHDPVAFRTLAYLQKTVGQQ